MSFSKTSIFCLILLMVFIVAPAMAHDASQIGNLRQHSHPTDGLGAVDLNNDGNTNGFNEGAVPAHNAHPTVKLSVETDLDATEPTATYNAIQIESDDNTTTAVREDEFKIRIKFSSTVATSDDVTSVLTTADAPIGGNSINNTVATNSSHHFTMIATRDDDGNPIGNAVDGNNSVIARATPRANTTETAKIGLTDFIYTIRVHSDVISALEHSTNPSTVTLKIRFNQNQVYSLQTRPASSFAARAGAFNSESQILVLKLVNENLDVIPPKLTISHTPEDGSPGNKATFTFSFNEKLSAITGYGLDAGDIEVTNGTKGKLSAGKYTAAVTGPPAKGPSTVYTLDVTLTDKTKAVTVKVKDDSVKDEAGNNFTLETTGHDPTFTPDNTAPKLTISHDPADGELPTGNVVTFTFTFDDAIGTGDAALERDDITLGGNGTKGQLSSGTFANGKTTYKLPVTIIDTYKPVTVTVNAKSVKDDAGNEFTGGGGDGATFTPGSILVLPAKSYVVVKKAGGSNSWAGMPDLSTIFTKTSGKYLNVMPVATSTYTPAAEGTVGISEIMWGLDAGIRIDGSLNPRAEQWIELHNLNKATVAVQLTISNAAAATGAIDNVSTTGWSKVPGQGGDSLNSNRVAFISMYRIPPNGQAAYKDESDQYKSKPGKTAANWRDSNVKTDKKVLIEHYKYNNSIYYIGTPGRVNTHYKAVARTAVHANKIIFNEVANRNSTDEAYEWIELRNVSGAEINLKNYKISAVTAVGTDKEIYTFPGDLKVPAGGILLLVDTDPKFMRDHPLQIGAEVRYHIAKNGFTNHLPDGNPANFVLILRGKGDNKGVGTGNANDILDIAGYHPSLSKVPYPATELASKTDLWPLNSFEAPASASNRFDVDTVHYRQHVKSEPGQSGVGTIHKDKKDEHVAFRWQGYTGVGYKRLSKTIDAHGGTPGYPNGKDGKASYHSSGDIVMKSVYISEIMYADNDKGVLPQWIEIRNTSKTVGVDLNAWRLTITNHADTDDGARWNGKGEGNITLDGLKIKPNSSVLITSRRAVQRIDVSTVHLPDSDIFILWSKDKDAFGMKSVNDDIFNPHGFEIKLSVKVGDKTHVIDQVGNLAKRREGADLDRNERADTERYDDPEWAWPDAGGDEAPRISVVRKAWSDNGTLIVSGDTKKTYGTKKWAWELSTEDAGHDRVAAFTYYGSVTDISSPGLTHGQALPVELSSFRPTLEDGKVTIRWTTESELDNAGFNIYRSETRDGEFKQVNAQLIQGAGTTGERNTYEWVDTTAKPDVVYYYQIEDVSFSGERQNLAQSRLKGYVSAKNKLTTRWGELKKTLQ